MMERNVHNKNTRIIHLAFLLPRDPVENVPYSTPSAPVLLDSCSLLKQDVGPTPQRLFEFECWDNWSYWTSNKFKLQPLH